jgi:phage terminase large subunit
MKHSTEIYIELYKRKQFDKIPVHGDATGLYYLSKKQLQALQYLFDSDILYVGYGGSGFSGKTQLECFWLLFNSLSYPDTRWMFGRSELTNLKQTSYQTLFKTLKFYGLEKDKDYKYWEQSALFVFNNESRIIGKDTKYYPSDGEYTDIGGLDLTGAVVDESAENKEKVFSILSSRVGRWNNDKYGLPAKILEGFNPLKNHVHTRYWKPFRNGTETNDRKFVRALSSDNPNPEARAWEKTIIKSGDKRTIERLLKGNFDYDDDDNALCNFEKINDIFTNDFVDRNEKGELLKTQNFMSCDIAISNDYFVCINWSGLRIVDIKRIKNISPTQIDSNNDTGIVNNKIDFTPLLNVLNEQAIKYQVPRSNIVYDGSGIGNHLVKLFAGAIPIRTGQILHKEYKNLKCELEYRLAQLINNGEIFCNPNIDSSIKEAIIEELQMLKRSTEAGEVLATMKKSEVKELLGRSPDLLDAMCYRLLFILTRSSYLL